MYVQTKLSRGNKKTTAWILKKKNLKVGSIIKIKELNENWKIESFGIELSNFTFGIELSNFKYKIMKDLNKESGVI